MVGYKKHDPLTPNQKFVAGCLSGVTTRFVTNPLDVIKLRLQIMKQKNVKSKCLWLHTFKNIMYNEGITALYHGHNLGQLYSVLAVSTQFYVYELTTRYVSNNTQKGMQRNALNFCCGIFAGCTSATVVSPLEVVRVRQMIGSKQYGGFVNSFKAVYQFGGPLAFYQGLTASLLMLGPQVGISFSVFNAIQPRILSYMHDCKRHPCPGHPGNVHTPESVLLASSVAGCFAGFISKTVTYPLDLVKKRMQVASHRQTLQEKHQAKSQSQKMIKCSRVLDCLTKTVKHDGFLGLYRGWMVTILKAQVTNIVAFTTYEIVCYAFRDLESTVKPPAKP